MNEGATAALSREIGGAGRGVLRLARFDPRWPEDFDFSAVGFYRSFFAPALALPFTLVLTALAATEGGSKPLTATLLWAAALTHVITALGFPLLVAAFARPFAFTVGYAGFIVLVNWSNLFITFALCAVSPLTLLGKDGFGFFNFFWLVLSLAQIFMIWRSARMTLSTEFPPALLMVVLWVAIGVASDQAALFVARLVS